MKLFEFVPRQCAQRLNLDATSVIRRSVKADAILETFLIFIIDVAKCRLPPARRGIVHSIITRPPAIKIWVTDAGQRCVLKARENSLVLSLKSSIFSPL